jgi:predicted DNA-binding transcriptional regulator AlpA
MTLRTMSPLAAAPASAVIELGSDSTLLLDPNDRLIDRKELGDKYAIKHSRGWLYELIRDGKFPMPLTHGDNRKHVWKESEIRSWLVRNLRPADLTIRSNEDQLAREQRRQRSREVALAKRSKRASARVARRTEGRNKPRRSGRRG